MLRGARRRGAQQREVFGGQAPAERNELERGASLSKPIKAAAFIPKGRLEALTDAVFAFAMTLLAINIELPEGFHPKTNQEFLRGLSGLSDTFTASSG
jgi:Endosomal/lysosomal potassium channel TMEM175